MGMFSCYSPANCGMFWWGVFSMFMLFYGIIKMWQRGDFNSIRKQLDDESQKQQTSILNKLEKVGIKRKVKKNAKEKKQSERTV